MQGEDVGEPWPVNSATDKVVQLVAGTLAGDDTVVIEGTLFEPSVGAWFTLHDGLGGTLTFVASGETGKPIAEGPLLYIRPRLVPGATDTMDNIDVRVMLNSVR